MMPEQRLFRFGFLVCLLALAITFASPTQAAETCGPNGCSVRQTTPRVVITQRVMNFQRRVTQPIRSLFSSRSNLGFRLFAR
jgi:hypothetical protein